MPELPEVQTTVNGIRERAVGLTIADTWTDYNSAWNAGKDNIKDPKYFAKFRKQIIGTKISSASRRGKNVLIHLSTDQTILIHMKMTGHVMYGKYKFANKTWVATEAGPLRDDPFNRFVHFVINFTNGYSLVLVDMRKFAKVTLIPAGEIEKSGHLSTHGPEPLEKSFGLAEFKKALARKPKAPIKLVLMNHEIISGIGNIYSDEILWRVSVHPLSKFAKIPADKFAPMLKATKDTLNRGIDFGGDSMSDYRNIHGERGKFQEQHNAYRKTETPCSLKGCKGKIARLKMGGRSAHYCDSHQKLYT